MGVRASAFEFYASSLESDLEKFGRERRERICSGLDACFEFVAVGDRIMKASERRCGGGGANNQESRILRKISQSYTRRQEVCSLSGGLVRSRA